MTDLKTLAELHGIATGYLDWRKQPVETPDAVIRKLLEIIGVPTDSETRIATEIVKARAHKQSPDPDAVLVVRMGWPIPVPADTENWSIVLEDGTHLRGTAGEAIAADVPLGYHRLFIETNRGLRETRLIVCPERCHTAEVALGTVRVTGLAVQFYALKGERDWGIGTYADLADLCAWAGKHGMDAIGMTPVHALFPADPDHESPYAPSSRRFLNVFHIDPAIAPGFADCPQAQTALADAHHQGELFIDYKSAWVRISAALEALFAHFEDNATPERQAELDTFIAEGGDPLLRQATFEVLHEHFSTRDSDLWSWHNWPEPYRNPDSIAVRDFRNAHPARIRYHMFMQWLADSQLARAQEHARTAGMRIGLIADLAIGIDTGGADAWARPDILPQGVGIGCPPDSLGPFGQCWGLVAPAPEALKAHAFDQFIDMLRSAMRHAGALRIDHAMGLMRMYWIPEGDSGDTGGYLRYPLEDLIGILALESVRNRCLVVAETLGTVPDGFIQRMNEAGIMGYNVLVLEHDEIAGMPVPDSFPPDALICAATQDIPTLKGFWEKTDLTWMDRLGLFPSPEVKMRMTDARERQIRDIENMLARLDLIDETARDGCYNPKKAVALHRYLARTPCRLMMMQLEDLLGQHEQANLPGTWKQHPNWRRRLPVVINALNDQPLLRDILDAVAIERP